MREQLAKVPGETFQIRLYPVDITAKKVVRQHGGDLNGEAGCSHEEGFANRPGDSVNRDLTGTYEADQGMVDAPHMSGNTS